MKRMVLHLWEPRLGSEAALSWWRYDRWFKWSAYTPFALVLGYWIGAEFNSVVIEVLSYVLSIGFFLAALVWLQPPEKKRFMVVASRTVGVEVTRQNFPPKGDVRYAEWCAKNGIRPGQVVGTV